MAASEELARRVVEAGRSCSLTTAVLEEWSRLGTPKQVEYLAGYLEAERSSREASKRATLLRRCALPAPKTFDGYDWSAVSWPEGMGRESLLALFFVERRENLVLMGDVGTGKTHMASALCALACERRLEARFFTASSLVMRLRLDWQHLFGRFREGQPRLPELDRRHVAQRRVDPEVVVPVHVVRELGPELARRAERLAVDELGLQYPVGRLVDGVVVGAALGRQRPLNAEGLEHQVDLGVVELAAAVRVEDLDVRDGEGERRNADLTSRASFLGPAEWPTISLL